MDVINKIDKYKLQANRLRKTVRQRLDEDSSGAEIASVLQRFSQSGVLNEEDNETTQMRRLKSFSLNKYLELIAREAGYDGWSEMSKSIKEQEPIDSCEDTELYKPGMSEFNLNVWCATYEDAREYLDTHKGYYLLQYKGKCFLAQAPHIQGLGLNPGDQDWEKIGRDWVKPKDPEAKTRLQEKLRQAREQAQG